MIDSIKWLGRSSFRIRAGNLIIYIDPYIVEYKDKADLILVSHSHEDHCDPSKIEEIRKEDTVVIAPSDCIPKMGGKAKSLKPGEKAIIEGITVEAVEAYNFKRFRSPGNPFHPKGSGVGYLVTIGDKKIYHAGDTDFIPEMKGLRNVYLALLPNGGAYTMDGPEAVDAALAIQPQFIIPMHSRNTNPDEFKNQVDARSSRIKVILLKPGEEFRAE